MGQPARLLNGFQEQIACGCEVRFRRRVIWQAVAGNLHLQLRTGKQLLKVVVQNCSNALSLLFFRLYQFHCQRLQLF